MANRTIQFCGYAYGNVPVQLNAHINGQTVFSGAVPTLNETPAFPVDWVNAPVLFSVTESALFPTSFSGSYPMTVSVATGRGIALSGTNSNYMPSLVTEVEFSGAISGTTLTVSGVTSGEIRCGQIILGAGITSGTKIISVYAPWSVNTSQTVSETSITGAIPIPGTATDFCICVSGNPIIPPNSEGTCDSRSSVQINGVPQIPPRTPTTQGNWPWWVEAGSTIEYNFNISAGSE
jgi:hypothetical protein